MHTYIEYVQRAGIKSRRAGERKQAPAGSGSHPKAEVEWAKWGLQGAGRGENKISLVKGFVSEDYVHILEVHNGEQKLRRGKPKRD